MAGIDKIYGTQEEYLEFKKWLQENQKPVRCVIGWSGDKGNVFGKALPTDFLYDEEWDNDVTHRPISNFPSQIDKWLMKNCPLEFMQKRLKEQYGL